MAGLLRAVVRRSLLLWAVGMVASYGILVFVTFFWEHESRFRGSGYSVLWSSRQASFQPEWDEFQGSHDLVLQSLEPATGVIRASYVVRDGDVGDIAYVCPVFGHEELTLSGSGSWAESPTVALTQKRLQDSFGVQYVAYAGDLAIHPIIKSDRFPFDAIALEITYGSHLASCKDKASALLRAPSFLNVTNEISGYVVSSRGIDFHHSEESTTLRLRLARSNFLRWTAILLACLGFISTLLVVRRMRRKGTEDWTPLAYLVALWGSRNILMTSIPEPRPFPTLVDVTVLYLFALAFGGWVIAHLHALSLKRVEEVDAGEKAATTKEMTVGPEADEARKTGEPKEPSG